MLIEVSELQCRGSPAAPDVPFWNRDCAAPDDVNGALPTIR
jgi:hypothetical protein